MMPTARSIMLPLRMNSLNSLAMLMFDFGVKGQGSSQEEELPCLSPAACGRGLLKAKNTAAASGRAKRYLTCYRVRDPGPAARTASLTPSAYCLKLRINNSARCAAAAS